ncbi:MAG: PHP domain-containing protein [Planctomycetes bacterium]|nr:PHP domain-containing protein [Planctomycetota bacterium]
MTGTGRTPPRRAAAAAALLGAALSAAACTAPLARSSLRADLERLRAGSSAPAPSTFGEDVTGVFHVHTRLSHDSPAPMEELVEAARRTGVRWICITDHRMPETERALPRGVVGGVLFVPGEECTVWGASVHGIGTSRHVPKTLRRFPAVEEAIRSSGGVPIFGHVTHFDRPPALRADGIGIYDLADDFRGANLLGAFAVLGGLSSGDPEESALSYLLFVQSEQREELDIWDRYLALGPCSGVAETDAHAKFRWFGRTWDPAVGLFALVRNHALLETVDEASVMEAVSRGRLHVGFDAAADTTGARFEAFLGDRPAACGGDAIPLDPALSLAVHLPLPAKVRVLRDGRTWRTGEGRFLSFPVGEAGVYRCEVDLVAEGVARRWVLFNPVRVLPPAADPGP